MREKEEILEEVTGIKKELIPEAIIKAKDAMLAMEIYVEEFIPDGRKEVRCDLCGNIWKSSVYIKTVRCPKCENMVEV